MKPPRTAEVPATSISMWLLRYLGMAAAAALAHLAKGVDWKTWRFA